MEFDVPAVLQAATGCRVEDIRGRQLAEIEAGRLDLEWDTSMLQPEHVTHVFVRGGKTVAVMRLSDDYCTAFNNRGGGNHDLCPGELLRLIRDAV